MTNPLAAAQVVHLDFIALSETASEADVAELIEEAAGLKAIEGVRIVGLIRAAPDGGRHRQLTPASSLPSQMPGVSTSGTAAATFHLAFFVVLDGFRDLEPFGTDPRYIRFLQGKVARLLKGFAGADVALTAPFPDVTAYAACLALAAPDETYDWEVREALEGWAADGEAAIGLAIGERQRYRGCVLRFTNQEQPISAPDDPRFQETLIVGRSTRL